MFYEFDFGKSLTIKDSLFKVNEHQAGELLSELDADGVYLRVRSRSLIVTFASKRLAADLFIRRVFKTGPHRQHLVSSGLPG